MRLPPKMRKRVEAIEKRTGIKLPDIQLPKGVVAAAFLLAIGVFVVRPLMGTLGGAEEAPNLVRAYGVWEAGTGKYAGRMFSCSAIASSSSWLCTDKSVPLGRYWRIRPLMFSLLPRCQGLCGSQK